MGYKEFKLEIPTVSNVQLKLAFIFHFIFISWATLHPWATQAYTIHGLIFLFLLLWTIIQDGLEQVLLCLGVNVVSVILDIIILSIFFPTYGTTTAEFSGVIAIFNLILRVYSSYLLYTEWCSRSGAMGVGVVDSSHNLYEGGAVRSASVLAHYPGRGSPRVVPNQSAELPDIPPSFTVVN